MYDHRRATILVAVISLALLLASCGRNQGSVPEDIGTAAIGTATGVAFQPPIGKEQVLTGNFDPELPMNIVVFRLDNNQQVASFSTQGNTIKVEHEPGVTEHYGANWNSRQAKLPDNTRVRIEVHRGNDTAAAPLCNTSDMSQSPAGCLAFTDVMIVKAPPKNPLKDSFHPYKE